MTRISTLRFRCLMTALLLATVAPALGFAATLEITGPAGASVVVNDRIMGFLPLNQPLTLAPGTYEIKSELPGYLPFVTNIELMETSEWQRLQIRPVPMSRTTAWTSNILFAGLGQHYMGKSFKGYFFNAAEAFGLLTALAGEAQRSNYRQDYLILQDKYESTIDIDEINYYKAQAEQTYSDMEEMEKMRNTGLIIAGSAIVLSILDAVFLFPSIEVGPGETPIDTGYHQGNPDSFDFGTESNPFQTVHAGIKLKF